DASFFGLCLYSCLPNGMMAPNPVHALCRPGEGRWNESTSIRCLRNLDRRPPMSNPPAETVLCVDDDRDNRQSLASVLQVEGFHLEEAASGPECLHKARHRPDLILLDVRLPDLNGFEVCRTIKANPTTAAIPIIQLSGHFVRGEDRVQGLEGGADAYLT